MSRDNFTTARKGDFTSLISGRQFWPLDPRPEEIDIEDIAHALSMQCRFGGHVREFYSVAEHSVRVSWHCKEFPLIGLLHDAAEAYLVDMPTPIKKNLGAYYDIEEKLLEVIAKRFGIDPDLLQNLPGEVQFADGQALATEQRDLRPHLPYWTPPLPAWGDCWIAPWSPSSAKDVFLRRAKTLGIR